MASRQLDEEAIFHVARQIPTTDARSTYLDQICAGDANLRSRIEGLLEVHEAERVFLRSADPGPTVERAPVSEGPGTQIGRYKLLQKIGEGGFGVVYMAEQQRPIQRKVALKIIKPGMDTQSVIARFEAERQALALMDHPNISRVFDGGATDSGRPYFVMELVKGVPITEYSDVNNLTTDDRLQLFMTVCQAVQHAHQKGIIHRDLKPSNILVTLADGKPIVKVIDFGVAKALNQRLTEKTLFTAFGQMVGTPQYMSPEQAEMSCLDVDTRSDIYSLGVLLYELLTGTTPLEGERLRTAGYAELQRIIREEEPQRPSTRLSTSGGKLTIIARHRGVSPERLHRTVRGDLDWIVMKALEKDRSRRYETASDFLADISRFRNHELIEARRPSLAHRMNRFIRRNLGAVSAGTALLLLLVIGIVATSMLWLKSERSNHELIQQQDKNRELIAEYQEELFQNALLAAVFGNQNTPAIIQRARDRGVSSDKLQMLEGQFRLYSGDPQGAIGYLENAARLEPDSVAAHSMLAIAYFYAGELMEWVRESNKAMNLQPSQPHDFLFKAQVYVGTFPEIGLRLLDQFVQDRPSALALVIRAELNAWNAAQYADRDSAEQALRDVQAAQQLMGPSPYVLQVSLFAHHVAVALARERGEPFAELDNEAAKIADTLTQKYPDYTWGRVGKAWYFDSRGEFAAAAREYEIAFRKNRNPFLGTAHAIELYRLGRNDDAIKAATSIQAPIYKTMTANMLLESPSHRGAAQSIYKLAVALAEKDEAYRDECTLRIPLMMGQAEECKQQAKRWLTKASVDGTQGPTYYGWIRNRVLYLAEEIDAGELLRRAGQNRSLQCDAHYLIGLKRLSTGDREGARREFEAATGIFVPWLFSFQLADAFKRHLDDPTWPDWIVAPKTVR